MAQLVALMSGVVLGSVFEVVGSNLARGKIFTASIGSVDSLYIPPYIYFQLKQSVCMEPYLSLTKFHHRQAICKIRISAHKLMNLEGIINQEERLCRNCCLNEL